MWTDPRASASESDSPRILKAPDIATIRLTRQIDDSEWHIIQDRLDKSIIRGLASSGGLWTALGGILSLLFGSSIMRIMFGQYISSASLCTTLALTRFTYQIRSYSQCSDWRIKVLKFEKNALEHMVTFLLTSKNTSKQSLRIKALTPLSVTMSSMLIFSSPPML